MNAALIAQLIAQYGIPLAQQLVTLHDSGTPVTPENFAEIAKLAQYRSADALAAAGIKLVNGKVMTA